MTQKQIDNIGKKMLSESKFFMGYSRWDDLENRYETWDKSVSRVMDMHRQKYKSKRNLFLLQRVPIKISEYWEHNGHYSLEGIKSSNMKPECITAVLVIVIGQCSFKKLCTCSCVVVVLGSLCRSTTLQSYPRFVNDMTRK